ncbi:MAG TPA: NUDIX hydrolase [Xanthobacteraceae bacterium]|jgi:8-oxo-dGTP pyrophosphatase MutT (NUDIX family)|nr:NUDIX hydrolase [Xanthobacteraceae bacterium]
MPDTHIVPVDRLDVGFAPFRWRFAETRRDDIAAHFAMRRQATPQLWNGRVLLMRDFAIRDGILRGTYFEAGFAEFLAWRDWNFPDSTVVNCFAMGALRASDGAYLLGVMGDHTANAGRIYFPAGTPDPDDVRGETVDLLGNVLRELAEETGLTDRDVAIASGWHAAVDASRVALMKCIDVPCPAPQARNRMLSHLARETQPELRDIRIVRSAADLDPDMPRFVTAYLMHMWNL